MITAAPISRWRWPRLGRSVSAVAGAMVLLTGCTLNLPPYVTDARLDAGLVIILPGIEGPSLNSASIRSGLKDGGLPYALEIYNWLGWRLGASYAYDIVGSRKRAGEVAARIAEYRRYHPGRPVFIVGHSGGGAIAVFAAEAVGEGEPLAGVVLLAPALSPGYDLTPAVSACSGRMLNCYSEADVMLRTATTVGRNFDQVPGPTAGQEGFVLPPGAPEHRRKAFEYLRQMPWERSMARQGNFGGHLGWTSRKWVAQTLAPVLRQWAEARPRPHPGEQTGPRPPPTRGSIEIVRRRPAGYSINSAGQPAEG